MNQNQLNKKQEEREEKRLSKIIKEVYDILLEDKNMTVNEASMAGMGIQSIIIEMVNKWKKDTLVASLKLLEKGDFKDKYSDKYKRVLEVVQGENIESTIKVLEEFSKLLSASAYRKTGEMKLEDLDIIKLMK